MPAPPERNCAARLGFAVAANQRRGQSEGAAGIARHREIVSRPFGESGPGLLQAAEAAEKRKNAGGQQYQESFEVIARPAMGAFVPQYRGQLIGR
jgi:hypothetical protein